MLESAHIDGSSASLSRSNGRSRQSDKASADTPRDTTEVGRRFGLAALAARRSTESPSLAQARLAVPTPSTTRADADETTAASSSPQTATETTSRPVAAERSLAPIETARAETIEQNKRVGLAAIAAANRAAAARQANRVKDGFSLSVLRATAGDAAGLKQLSSGIQRRDDDTRASLFDTSRSGQGLVDRLRAQVRPSSPLNALGAGGRSLLFSPSTPSMSGTGPMSGAGGLLSSAASSTAAPSTGGLSSLRRANAQRASLGSSLLSLDNSSRRLLSTANANRTSGGFGLASLSRSAIDLIG